MRHFFLAFCLSAGAPVLAQPALFKQAIINTTTTIISPEGEEDNMPPPPPPGNNGEEMHMMRFGGDGETKSTTFLKNGLIKTVTNTEMGNNTVIRDSKNKKTTTLMEMMGNKTAFYATDEEQEQMRLRMDSLMKSKNPDQAPSDPISVVIAYTNEIRKIAGYACKKAFIITTRPKGKKDSSIVWYCPDFKLEGVVTTGGLTGGPMSMGLGRPGVSSAFAKLEGFPMQYQMTMRRGRKMVVEVTKLDTSKEIADKEFEIPKDYDLKPMKDMQNGDGPGMQIRIQR